MVKFLDHPTNPELKFLAGGAIHQKLYAMQQAELSADGALTAGGHKKKRAMPKRSKVTGRFIKSRHGGAAGLSEVDVKVGGGYSKGHWAPKRNGRKAAACRNRVQSGPNKGRYTKKVTQKELNCMARIAGMGMMPDASTAGIDIALNAMSGGAKPAKKHIERIQAQAPRPYRFGAKKSKSLSALCAAVPKKGRSKGLSALCAAASKKKPAAAPKKKAAAKKATKTLKKDVKALKPIPSKKALSKVKKDEKKVEKKVAAVKKVFGPRRMNAKEHISMYGPVSRMTPESKKKFLAAEKKLKQGEKKLAEAKKAKTAAKKKVANAVKPKTKAAAKKKVATATKKVAAAKKEVKVEVKKLTTAARKAKVVAIQKKIASNKAAAAEAKKKKAAAAYKKRKAAAAAAKKK